MSSTVLALDIGTKKIGIARANLIARIAEPLITLPNDQSFNSRLATIIADQDACLLVVGLPRGLNGQDTKQTEYVRRFLDELPSDIPVHLQDEALTSVKAEQHLARQKKGYQKQDIDAQAATIILEDYLMEYAK